MQTDVHACHSRGLLASSFVVITLKVEAKNNRVVSIAQMRSEE